MGNTTNSNYITVMERYKTMNKFNFFEARSIEEAFLIYIKLKKNKKDPVYIAGGTDLIINIKKKKITPKCLISINNIKNYKCIKFNKKSKELTIGSFVTHRELENSNLVRENYKILHDAIKCIGSTQIRNVATIGGNIVNAAPSADSVIPLIALDSFICLEKGKEKRTLKLSDFFVSPNKTVLKQGEILTKIIIPKTVFFSSGSYRKIGYRNSMELPIVSVGVFLSLDSKMSICKKARICLGVAAPTPIRILKAEKFLEGGKITEERLTESGIISAEESKVRDSYRGKAWFRKRLISTYVKRAGLLAIQRIKNMHNKIKKEKLI